MTKNLIFSIVLTILLVTYGCAPRDGTADTGLLDSVLQEKDTLEYHITTFKEISPYFSGDGTSVDTTYCAARYPVFSPEIDSLVRDAIFVDGEHTPVQIAESFLGGFNEYAEEQLANEDNSLHAWFRNQNCEVVLNVPGFLTLRNIVSEYTGGAHGIEVEIWSNYDLHDMKKLTLADLFQDTLGLNQIVETYFREQEQLSDTSSYGNRYFFDDETFRLADNFGLTPGGLLFHYNPYEIKSYAEGPTQLLIPYDALEAIMTEKAKKLLK